MLDRRDFIRKSAVVGAAVGSGALVSGLGSAGAEASSVPLRPPGSLEESDFASTCIRCLKCVDACPNHALEPIPVEVGSSVSGTPTMKPRSASCMLCANVEGDFLKCTEVCPSGALQLVRKTEEDIQAKVKIGVAEIDFDLCYSYNNWSCGACYRACPLADKAMTIGLWERPEIHPEFCVGCGCCERSCIRYPQAVRVRVRDE